MSISKRLIDQQRRRGGKLTTPSELHAGGDLEYRMSQKSVNDMIKRLSDYEMKVGKKVVRKAVRSGSKVIQDRIRFAAPKITGTLRRNIVTRVRFSRRSKSIYALIGAKWIQDSNKNPAIYMHILEHGGKYLSRGTNPFAEVAFNASRQQAVASVVNTMKTEINKLRSLV